MTVDEARKLSELEALAKRLGLQLYELEMSRAVATSLVRDIVADSRRSNLLSSIAARTKEEGADDNRSADRGSGWAPEQSLKPPEGIKWVDQQLDEADRRDKQDLKARLAKIDRGD